MTERNFGDTDDLSAIAQLDETIERLRLGFAGPEETLDEPVLGLLIDLRDDIDDRVGALLGFMGAEEFTAQLEARLTAPQPTEPSGPTAAALVRRTARHRLAVLPVAAALVLGSTGVAAAFSSSPHTPLYPLHTLLFGKAPGVETQIRRDLTAAETLLDSAAAEPVAHRTPHLTQARSQLSVAQTLLADVRSPATRFQLAATISADLQRATQLALSRPQAPTAPSPSTLHPAAPDPSAVAPVPDESATAVSGDNSASESPSRTGSESAGGEGEPASGSVQQPTQTGAPDQPQPVTTAGSDDGGSGYTTGTDHTSSPQNAGSSAEDNANSGPPDN